LPGIGPVLSARIIKYRNILGGYADVRQLLEVYGLKEEVFEIIKGRVIADTLVLKRICVNSDSYADLLRHPYLESEHVKAIVGYRERIGPIADWKVLRSNNMIPAEKEEFLRYYIIF
jgi:DNA uptake protein ComE-like DNA-binding protein